MGLILNREEYLDLMSFPKEWRSLGLLPDELVDQLIETYEPGNEQASEHDRNGVFHWWLKQSPKKDVLISLVHLSFLDPDQVMATDVRTHIFASTHADEEVKKLMGQGAGFNYR